jgi:hypothetical protein
LTVPGLPMAAASIDLPPPPVAEQAARPSMRRRAVRLAKAVVAAVIVASAILVAYQREEALREARHSPAQVPVFEKAAPRRPMRRRRYQRFKPAHVVGPWRCTDQNTGA